MSLGSFFEYPDAHPKPAPAEEPSVFLAGLDEAGWDRLLNYVEVRRFEPGEIIVPAGSADRFLGIVADGELEMQDYGTGALTMVGVGAVFGESAFLEGRAHPDTIRAATDVDLLVLSPSAFDVLAAREPILARAILTDLGRVLARQLREMRALR